MALSREKLNEGLLEFIGGSPTPFHAAESMARALSGEGFRELEESEAWELDPGNGYFVRRGGSVIAFRLAAGDPVKSGFRLVGAHTDSPCLRVKPNPGSKKGGLLSLGVEVYGGVLLYTWFDRDLSIAGKVGYESGDGVKTALVDFKRPVATIPSLAIHLFREVHQNRTLNPQKELPPVFARVRDKRDFNEILLEEVRREDSSAGKVLGYELSLYDVQAPAMVGLNGDFIASARLDNLLSCYVGLQALLQGEGGATGILVCNNHEEVGSASTSGAQGPFLQGVLERIAGGRELLNRVIPNSLLISCDNAHALHPNYPEMHDANHGPLINGGPVIKINANQRYATNSETASRFAHLCQKADVPCQRFVTRADMACGSTIGPLTSTVTGIPAIDVGVPQLAMHSIREMAGAEDTHHLYTVLSNFYGE